MVLFRRFALLSTIATYILIFVGGLVRVSGAGLGCPDWPKCFGSWIPPFNISQLPPHIDPVLFNVTLAWIEYGNRLVGVLIGFFIAITGVLAIKYYRNQKSILYPSIAAAILVAFQGWQGSRVVASLLKPHIISLHLAIALIIISLLVYVTFQVFVNKKGTVKKDLFFIKILQWVWGITLIQIFMGTEVRGYLETILDMKPWLTDDQLMRESNFISYIHGFMGILTAAGFWIIYERLMRSKTEWPEYLIFCGKSGLVLMILQILAGVVLIVAGRPAVLQLIHLWIASLAIGILVVIYAALKTAEKENS